MDHCGRFVYNEQKGDPTLCQPNYRKWCSIWKKNPKYATFDPDIYYHSKGWFGTPDPEHCDGPLKTTAAKIYCKDNRERCSKRHPTRNPKEYALFKGGKTRRKYKH